MTTTALDQAAPPARLPRANRRQAIASAALQILGEYGSRGLTHRAIDRQLDLPEGTTSAYFRRREDLVSATVRELFRRDFARFESQMGKLRASGETVSLERVVEFFTQMIRDVRNGSSANEMLARYECFLLVRRDKETNRLLMELFDARQELDEWLFACIGADDPRTAAVRFGFAMRGAFFSLAFLPEPAERLDVVDEDYIRGQILAAMA